MSPESGGFAFLPLCRPWCRHPLATCSDVVFLDWCGNPVRCVIDTIVIRQRPPSAGTLSWSAWAKGGRHAGEGAEIRECEGESMPQNIYDDPEFFAGYSQLRRSREGLAGAPE